MRRLHIVLLSLAIALLASAPMPGPAVAVDTAVVAVEVAWRGGGFHGGGGGGFRGGGGGFRGGYGGGGFRGGYGGYRGGYVVGLWPRLGWLGLGVSASVGWGPWAYWRGVLWLLGGWGYPSYSYYPDYSYSPDYSSNPCYPYGPYDCRISGYRPSCLCAQPRSGWTQSCGISPKEHSPTAPDALRADGQWHYFGQQAAPALRVGFASKRADMRSPVSRPRTSSASRWGRAMASLRAASPVRHCAPVRLKPRRSTQTSAPVRTYNICLAGRPLVP